MALADLFKRPAKQVPPPREEGASPSGGVTPAKARAIDKDTIAEAIKTLQEYKAAKGPLEDRIVKDEEWYRLSHWGLMRQKQATSVAEQRPEPTSAWLFNTLAHKHADAMDNYPEPNILPREPNDQKSASLLSSVLPVVLEQNDFEETYADAWWYKLKHGTACYGVFWDKERENGLGDIAVRRIDMLNVFWEPGITDIQQSRNVFIVDLVSNDMLEAEYPEMEGKTRGDAIAVARYLYEDDYTAKDKSVVVDWYYKTKEEDGRTLLQYCKFCGSTVLFASEGNPEYPDGWYSHGMYPIVFDVLFPEEGTPVGFGYISITRDPQMYIDKLNQVLLENAMMVTKARYFVSERTDMNVDEFMDWSKPLVRVQGELTDERIRQIKVDQLPAIYLNLLQFKIDELKETSANRDFSQGGSGAGVTAAAAIAALQEAGNKTSRDMIAASYRSYSKVCNLAIEMMRQFYDEVRHFRIVAPHGELIFEAFSNSGIKDQPTPAPAPGMEEMVRRPVFDVRVKPQKRSPYSRMSQNEMAKEMYSMGFFDPMRADQALGALEIMEFEGKDKVIERVQQGQTLMAIIQQMQAEMQKMAMVIDGLSGGRLSSGQQEQSPHGASPPATDTGGGKSLASKVDEAGKANMTAYGERLAKNAQPDPQSGGKVGV